jgi:hypothetical protein
MTQSAVLADSSTDQVDASAYGPNLPYTSTTWIKGATPTPADSQNNANKWDRSNNTLLW